MSNAVHLTDSELDLLERLCATATPAPWRLSIEGRDHEAGSSIIQTGAGTDIEMNGATVADFEFVSHAREMLPRLLREIRELRARR